ncbi:MAG: hypothetical protein ACYCW6_22570 [Candidatus Xenobia bacterium]
MTPTTATVLLAGAVCLLWLIFLGLVLPWVSRLIALLWLHNIRDTMYDLVLDQNPWFRELRFYRVSERLITIPIRLVRDGKYHEVVGYLGLLWEAGRGLQPEVRQENKLLAELNNVVGRNPQRLKVKEQFVELVNQVERPLLFFMVFGRFLGPLAALVIGFCATVQCVAALLHRRSSKPEPQVVVVRKAVKVQEAASKPLGSASQTWGRRAVRRVSCTVPA